MTDLSKTDALLDRDAVGRVLVAFGADVRVSPASPAELLGKALDAVMDLARPMPTRDQIAAVLLYEEGSEWAADTSRHYELADAVLALINGGAS